MPHYFPELYSLFHIDPCFLKAPVLISDLYCLVHIGPLSIDHVQKLTWRGTPNQLMSSSILFPFLILYFLISRLHVNKLLFFKIKKI